jgi:hypothetical protein
MTNHRHDSFMAERRKPSAESFSVERALAAQGVVAAEAGLRFQLALSVLI